MAGERLDLSSEPNLSNSKREDERQFLGVMFDCCSVYCRIYINAAKTAYEGHCPRCSKPVRVRVGPGGSDSRFFRVS